VQISQTQTGKPSLTTHVLTEFKDCTADSIFAYPVLVSVPSPGSCRSASLLHHPGCQFTWSTGKPNRHASLSNRQVTRPIPS